ncbi:MAG: TonB-dependent receptor plug domain-containing protein, partial [Candidatus Amulumruptor sp.]|nr:TonB-dependent receptor plug domain-containing protein [Candidatus Amulumruptor sp.]
MVLACCLTSACGGSLTVYAQTQGEAQDATNCVGTVTDATGEPVIGASVIVAGTGNGAATDLDGNFSLRGVALGAIIKIASIGCKPVEVKWEGQPLAVTLSDDSQLLSEVVVTALGMKRDKKALGYAVTEVKGDDLNGNIINPTNALQGKVAGVEINQSDGGMFGTSKILIRGASTLGANNQPIYVVDGIILDNAVHENSADYSSSNNDYGNELKNLNPADFESVSVLKGAAATALYGSRGLNGAIVITTKSGKGSKGFGVTVSQTFGIDRMTHA